MGKHALMTFFNTLFLPTNGTNLEELRVLDPRPGTDTMDLSTIIRCLFLVVWTSINKDLMTFLALTLKITPGKKYFWEELYPHPELFTNLLTIITFFLLLEATMEHASMTFTSLSTKPYKNHTINNTLTPKPPLPTFLLTPHLKSTNLTRNRFKLFETFKNRLKNSASE
jgi:hypothetical protein